MATKFCKTLLAGAIAALLAAPAFATSDTTKARAQASAETGQVGQPQSTPGESTGATSDTTKAGAPASTETEAGQVGQPQSTPAQTTGPAADQAGSQDAVANLQQIDNLIYSWSAEALRGMEIVGQSGDEIGTVENVLLAPDRRSVYVVITMGGLVGIGSREALVSLDEIRAVDDKLRMSATEEQIEALPDYPPEPYTELKGDSPLIGSLVERSALERDRGAPGSTPGLTTAGMTQEAVDQAPETGRQTDASPQATVRTDSASPQSDTPSSTRSATSQGAVDGAETRDASKSTEAPEMEARDRSTTERPEVASAATRMPRSPLYGRSADNLNGAKVVDRARNEVGTVEKVVLTPDHKSAFVVIDLDGGFLGIGSRSIVVSLDELEAVDDGLMMSVTHEAVDAHREYFPKQYVELSGNWPISEAIVDFAAFETAKDTPGPAAPGQ